MKIFSIILVFFLNKVFLVWLRFYQFYFIISIQLFIQALFIIFFVSFFPYLIKIFKEVIFKAYFYFVKWNGRGNKSESIENEG